MKEVAGKTNRQSGIGGGQWYIGGNCVFHPRGQIPHK